MKILRVMELLKYQLLVNLLITLDYPLNKAMAVLLELIHSSFVQIVVSALDTFILYQEGWCVPAVRGCIMKHRFSVLQEGLCLPDTCVQDTV